MARYFSNVLVWFLLGICVPVAHADSDSGGHASSETDSKLKAIASGESGTRTLADIARGEREEAPPETKEKPRPVAPEKAPSVNRRVPEQKSESDKNYVTNADLPLSSWDRVTPGAGVFQAKDKAGNWYVFSPNAEQGTKYFKAREGQGDLEVQNKNGGWDPVGKFVNSEYGLSASPPLDEKKPEPSKPPQERLLASAQKPPAPASAATATATADDKPVRPITPNEAFAALGSFQGEKASIHTWGSKPAKERAQFAKQAEGVARRVIQDALSGNYQNETIALSHSDIPKFAINMKLDGGNRVYVGKNSIEISAASEAEALRVLEAKALPEYLGSLLEKPKGSPQ